MTQTATEMLAAYRKKQWLLIGGKWVPATANRTFDVVGPVSASPVTVAAAATPEDAACAVAFADAAFPVWSAAPALERAEVLRKAAALLDERTTEIAETMLAECGATARWCVINCNLAAEMLRHAASVAGDVDSEAPLPSSVPGLKSLAIRQAAGVVVGIAPWNSPVILGVRAVATPLAYGNTVVLKGSEVCPRTHGAVARAIADAGAPPGVINLITNAPDDAARVVDALITHQSVRRINFTGSTKVGRIIAARAAEFLKPTLLELGGKAPLVVLADADLDHAAAAVGFGAFMNSGQICMSTERVIVDRSVVPAFETTLRGRVARLKVGDPADPTTDVGPVISAAAAQHCRELIADAIANDARAVIGETNPEGLSVAPTILADVTPSMRVYYEESFGPVVAIIPVDGPDEAIAVANDTEFGLSAAVFGRDLQTAMAVGRRIRSGMCHINGATVHDEPQVPFGGVKYSGWGRFGGSSSLQEFTDLRWMSVQEGTRQYPI